MRQTKHTRETENPRSRRKRVVRNGLPTNELVISAFLDGNDRAFPKILQLYVAPGSTVADVTYGKGSSGDTFRPTCTISGRPTFRPVWIAASCRMTIRK